ncbi:hypothetical protein ACTVNX_15530 [Serratia nevei]|uniref:hypothetical protein n=1 Tax=Serratia TaxID=613 RepID=UPI0018D82BD8|nr:hypothetical protein [Serratia marcescens]MBI6127724.1 hypothetical protein [Serratia marcescens]MBN5303468.1 hypothetical protein [Serratia marcescens]MDU6303161.1 hypothetical protein [Serratia marcescens]
MKKIISALALCFMTSFFANATTLDAYLSHHKEIDEDPILGEYVRKWAWFMALMNAQQNIIRQTQKKLTNYLMQKVIDMVR